MAYCSFCFLLTMFANKLSTETFGVHFPIVAPLSSRSLPSLHSQDARDLTLLPRDLFGVPHAIEAALPHSPASIRLFPVRDRIYT